MKQFIFCVLTFSVVACSSPAEKAVSDIRSMEQNERLKNSDSLIHTYMRYADAYPEDHLAPVFLFKAAQISIKGNKLPMGARLYERVGTEYKKDTLAPEALIRGGIAYASIPDPANAKRLYDMFIASFPNHERINEVKMWSETVGMTEEELLRRFQEKFIQNGDSLSR